jgi:transposase-like protein
LSFRDVEDLLAERRILVSYEIVRRWVNHFGPMIAADLRKRRPKPHTIWHLDEKRKHIGTGGAGKTAVLGILRRKNSKSGSKVKAKAVPNVRAATLKSEIRENVEPGSRLYTDAWASYRGLGGEYNHEVIDHAVEYVRGTVPTNGH